MRITIPLAVAVLLGACAGDEVDPGNGAVCSMALYDECNQEHDCMSNDCRNFIAEGFQVCTQACSAAVPCPDHNGVAVACENSICKPATATDCRILP